MPHLQIQYSENLSQCADIDELCRRLAKEIVAIGLYPLGGVRVRAFATAHYAIADLHAENKFLDMVFRIGKGRSLEERKQTGDRLMALVEGYFAEELPKGYLMLSLEIVEIEGALSWKTNSVHQRLAKTTT